MKRSDGVIRRFIRVFFHRLLQGKFSIRKNNYVEKWGVRENSTSHPQKTACAQQISVYRVQHSNILRGVAHYFSFCIAIIVSIVFSIWMVNKIGWMSERTQINQRLLRIEDQLANLLKNEVGQPDEADIPINSLIDVSWSQRWNDNPGLMPKNHDYDQIHVFDQRYFDSLMNQQLHAMQKNKRVATPVIANSLHREVTHFNSLPLSDKHQAPSLGRAQSKYRDRLDFSSLPTLSSIIPFDDLHARNFRLSEAGDEMESVASKAGVAHLGEVSQQTIKRKRSGIFQRRNEHYSEDDNAQREDSKMPRGHILDESIAQGMGRPNLERKKQVLHHQSRVGNLSPADETQNGTIVDVARDPLNRPLKQLFLP